MDLKVTLNNSCQEITSQSLEDSTHRRQSNDAHATGGSLWSDEVELMQVNDSNLKEKEVSQAGAGMQK